MGRVGIEKASTAIHMRPAVRNKNCITGQSQSTGSLVGRLSIHVSRRYARSAKAARILFTSLVCAALISLIIE